MVNNSLYVCLMLITCCPDHVRVLGWTGSKMGGNKSVETLQ